MSPILGIWASQGRVAGTSFDSIATVTVGSGGSSSVTFSSIPSTYTHLQIRITGQTTRSANANDIINCRFNDDSGSNYTDHWLYGDGSSAGAIASTSRTDTRFGYIGSTNIANSIGGSVVDILDYANTNKYKTVRALTGVDNNNTSGWLSLNSGLWMSTSAITKIVLYPNVGPNFSQYSSFALYGIKAA